MAKRKAQVEVEEVENEEEEVEEEVEEEAPKAKGKKKPAKEEAKESKVKAGTGRPASEETLEMLKTLERLSKRKNGVTNVELAAELNITTARASALARQLLNKGTISMEKNESGRVTYMKAA